MIASAWQMPQVPPASTVMLHSVMRASMFMRCTTGPSNSTIRSVAPLTPMRPMTDRMTSLAKTPCGSSPVRVTFMVCGGAERADAFQDPDRQVGGADAGGEGAERAVGAGVGIPMITA